MLKFFRRRNELPYFVEKKSGFDLDAKRLENELRESLQLKGLEKVRLLNRYDVFGIDSEELAKAKSLYSQR